ncbi:MAG TPA: hypothetical protein VHT53_08545 [Candidatus Elarobacter sp.]|nr:hypothetical protein [Candidatus Elarobacter sp.]
MPFCADNRFGFGVGDGVGVGSGVAPGARAAETAPAAGLDDSAGAAAGVAVASMLADTLGEGSATVVAAVCVLGRLHAANATAKQKAIGTSERREANTRNPPTR